MESAVIPLYILAAIVVVYGLLCGLGALVDRRRGTDPRNGSV